TGLTRRGSTPSPTTALVAAPDEAPPRPSRLTRAYVEREGSNVAPASVRVAGRPSGRARLPWLLGGLLVIAATVVLALSLTGRQRGEVEEPSASRPEPAPPTPIEQPVERPPVEQPVEQPPV